MPTTPNGTAYTWHDFTPAGGDLSRYAAPDNSNGPIDLILFCHGAGGLYDQFSSSVFTGLRNRIIDAGWGYVESYGHGDNWGSPQGMTDYRLAYEYAEAQLGGVRNLVVLGRSMGGLVASSLYVHDPVISQKASGLIVNSGTQDLVYRYSVAGSTQKAEFRAQYGVSTEAEWLAMAPAYDPMQFPLGDWAGRKVMQLVGDMDDGVPPAMHGLAMRARVHKTLSRSVLDVRYGGDHSAANGSYLQVEPMFQFIQQVTGRARNPVSGVYANHGGTHKTVQQILILKDGAPTPVDMARLGQAP